AAAAHQPGGPRPGGGRAGRDLGRGRPREPRLARPDRRPGPRRDRADAGGKTQRGGPNARAPTERAPFTGPRAGRLAVDARARAGPLATRLVPGDALAPTAGESSRD